MILKALISNIRYIFKHKYLVFVECCKLGIPLRGLLHDLSKFKPDEFIPYMQKFYLKNANSEEFRLAWVKHLHRNPHHWQYWVSIGKPSMVDPYDLDRLSPIEMPEEYRKEMLADWRAIAKGGGTSVKEFYQRNKNKIVLHYETRLWLEKEIEND